MTRYPRSRRGARIQTGSFSGSRGLGKNPRFSGHRRRSAVPERLWVFIVQSVEAIRKFMCGRVSSAGASLTRPDSDFAHEETEIVWAAPLSLEVSAIRVDSPDSRASSAVFEIDAGCRHGRLMH